MNRLRRHSDEGATLIIVLIIVTVIGVVLGVVLSLVDNNVRSSVGIADEANLSYGIDGAAQVAVKQLQQGKFPGSNCATTTVESSLFNNWIPASGSSSGASMAIQCIPNPSNTNGSGQGNTSPGSALLTLGSGTGGEDGIWDGSSNNATFKVSGGIFSNSNINLGSKSSGTGASGNQKSVIENVATTSYIYAMSNCSPNGPGSIIVHGATTTTCNYSSNPLSSQDRRGMDPRLVPGHGTSFDLPTAPTSAAAVPACTGKKVYELQPGLYTSATQLNALTNTGNNGACDGSIVHFNHGTYYFNFTDASPAAHKWTTSSAYVVAGTPTANLKVSSPPVMTVANPACYGPGTAQSTTTSGVLFVFGGDSRMDFTHSGSSNGDIEICASNAASGPPVAIYGLWNSIGAGAMQVPALTGCITATPYVYGGDLGHCAIIQSYQDPSPIFTLHGTVYVPTAPIDITFNNSSAQYFQWGLVARTILVSSTGSASAMNNAVISVPNDAPSPFATPSTMYLDVSVCPGQNTCSASNSPALRVKVQLSADGTSVSVLSWSRQS
jgi:hypothetical protein